MAVRQHLYELKQDGLVDFEEAPRPVGRPAKMWRLTPAADEFFPDSHAELAVGLIRSIQQTFGETGMEQLLTVRAAEQTAQYRSAMQGAINLDQRLAALARVRSTEGYMASVEPQGQDRFLFIENHCPVCAAANACTGICAKELQVFQESLGSDVQIERTEHIIAGARRCAYTVEPRTGQTGKPRQ